MVKEKSSIAIPIWMATTILAASIGFPVWIVKSISDLRASVAGLSAKVEFITGTQQLAKRP